MRSKIFPQDYHYALIKSIETVETNSMAALVNSINESIPSEREHIQIDAAVQDFIDLYKDLLSMLPIELKNDGILVGVRLSNKFFIEQAYTLVIRTVNIMIVEITANNTNMFLLEKIAQIVHGICNTVHKSMFDFFSLTSIDLFSNTAMPQKIRPIDMVNVLVIGLYCIYSCPDNAEDIIKKIITWAHYIDLNLLNERYITLLLDTIFPI